jgi:hypothetical protein
MFDVMPLALEFPSSSTHWRLVKSHPAGSADSVTVYEPGVMFVNDWLPVPPEVAIGNEAGDRPPVDV